MKRIVVLLLARGHLVSRSIWLSLLPLGYCIGGQERKINHTCSVSMALVNFSPLVVLTKR